MADATPPTREDYVLALKGQGNWLAPETITPDQYSWPNRQDIELSKKNDMLYGSPHAPNATPGAANVLNTPSSEAVTAWSQNPRSSSTPYGTTRSLNTQADADRTREQFAAAERSAVAKLGWDPGRTTTTDMNPDQRFSVDGLYNPYSDIAWHRRDRPNTAMHESMHRGIEMLRNAGKLTPAYGSEEEQYVRALMNRAYGPVELAQTPHNRLISKEDRVYKQIMQGKDFARSPQIDEIERLAADEIARRHPRGPR